MEALRPAPRALTAVEEDTLRERLRVIDALYPGSPFRRAFRAAACKAAGCKPSTDREMECLLAEGAAFHGKTAREINEVTMGATVYLATRRPAPN